MQVIGSHSTVNSTKALNKMSVAIFRTFLSFGLYLTYCM